MVKLKLIIGLVLIFAVGALVGAMATSYHFKSRFERFASGGPAPPVRTALMMERLSSELDLDETQKAAIETILVEAEGRIDKIRQKSIPEIDTITEQSYGRIREKLKPEQQQRFDKLYLKVKRIFDRIMMQQAFAGKMADRMVSDLKKRLALTQEQESKIRPILEKGAAQRGKLFDKDNGRRADSRTMEREIDELDEEISRRIEPLLTPEQLQKYRQMR